MKFIQLYIIIHIFMTQQQNYNLKKKINELKYT